MNRCRAALACLFVLAAGPLAACQAGIAELRGDWGRIAFRVELADSAEERARGLMFRDSMGKLEGMLFVYPRPQSVSFWMRNTLIPLDMLFLDRTGTVRRIHENAVPLDETPIPGGNAILAVLEINGGLAAELGIVPGTVLRHSAMPQDDAAWRCND